MRVSRSVRPRRFLLLACALAALSNAAYGADEGIGVGTDFGRSFKPLDAKLTRTRSFIRIEKPLDDTPRYYRLRVAVSNLDGQPWRIAIRSPAGQVLSIFDQSETACQSVDGCWTVRLKAPELEVAFETKAANASAEVREGIYMPSEAIKAYYSVVEGSTIRTVSELGDLPKDRLRGLHEQADRLGMFIGSARTSDGAVNWCCSGVRLTDDLFLTNWHCGAADGNPVGDLWSDGATSKICRSGIVDMSYDGDELGREFGCREVVFGDADLDAVVLRLSRLADGPALTGPTRPLVFGGPTDPAPNTELALFHHPVCKPKSVTLACNVASATVPGWRTGTGTQEFSHLCTTEHGSSGGPVFDKVGRLVGLHHQAKDPTRGPGNFAIRISDLLFAIRDGGHRTLFDEIMAAADAPASP